MKCKGRVTVRGLINIFKAQDVLFVLFISLFYFLHFHLCFLFGHLDVFTFLRVVKLGIKSIIKSQLYIFLSSRSTLQSYLKQHEGNDVKKGSTSSSNSFEKGEASPINKLNLSKGCFAVTIAYYYTRCIITFACRKQQKLNWKLGRHFCLKSNSFSNQCLLVAVMVI